MQDDADTAWLREQVDGALGEVRRAESVTPAATVAALVAGVPLLLMVIVATALWLM